MIANMSSAAVGARLFTESMTTSPRPRPAPAKSPKIVGTSTRATTGVSFFVMIRVMKTPIMRKPRMTSTGFLLV